MLLFLARRLTNNEIGEELFISPITVKNHIDHIAEKLGVSGRRAAVARAGELGLFDCFRPDRGHHRFHVNHPRNDPFRIMRAASSVP